MKRRRSGGMWGVIDAMKDARPGETLTDVLGRKAMAAREAQGRERNEAMWKHGDWDRDQDRLPVPGSTRPRRERGGTLGEFLD